MSHHRSLLAFCLTALCVGSASDRPTLKLLNWQVQTNAATGHRTARGKPATPTPEDREQESTFELGSVDFHQDPPGYFPDIELKTLAPSDMQLEVLTTDAHNKLAKTNITIAWQGEYPIVSPGDFESIFLNTGNNWPARVRLKLSFRYHDEGALGMVLLVGTPPFPNEGSGFLLCGVDPPSMASTAGAAFTITYWLDEASTVTARIARAGDGLQVYSTTVERMTPGLHRLEWDPSGQSRGDYVARVDAIPIVAQKRERMIVTLFRIRE